MKLVITDNLSFTDYHHGNSLSMTVLHSQSKSRMSLYLSVNDKLSVMTSSMKCPPEILFVTISFSRQQQILLNTRIDIHSK